MVVFHNDIINAIAQARNIRHLLASDILERWQQGQEATQEQTQSLIQLGDWIDFLTDSEQLIVDDCIDSTDVWNIIQKIGEQAIGLDCVGTNYNYSNPPPTPTPNVFNYVESVTGLNTNNADPQNPVVRISVDGTTIIGDGTPASPLMVIGGGGGGGVSSVSATAGTGISVTVTNPTTTPNINIVNTAPDQTVVINDGSGIDVTGSYPNFTVDNTDKGSSQNIFKNVKVAALGTLVADNNNDTLSFAAGAGINLGIDLSADEIRIDNSAPDQTVVLNAGTGIGVTGTYPNFTISNTGGGGNANIVYITKANLITLGSTSGISTTTFYIVTDAAAGQLLTKGKTSTTIDDGVLNLDTGESGTYVLSTDTFTIATPDLQQVTDAGATTTNGITVDNGAGESINVKHNLIKITNALAADAVITSPNLTTTTTFEIPDKLTSPQTFAMLSDIATPDLQQVLDEGNVSTTSLRIDDGAGNRTSVDEYGVTIQNPLGGIASIISPTLDETVIFELPDKPAGTQTFAMLSDITGGGSVNSVTAGTNISVTGTSTDPIINSLSDRYKTTSLSSVLIGNGSKTFTVDANLSYIPLQEVLVVFNSSNHMHGTVTSYSGTTLIVDIKHHTGSGTYALWSINLDGTPVDAITGTGTANRLAYFTATQVIDDVAAITAARALKSDANGLPVHFDTAIEPSLTELSYVKGVTSAIQTQLNGKEATITAGTTAQYWRGDKSWQTLDKTAVGLGNVDNTSDATKNSATATLTNKRINARTGTVASSATPTINTDNVDYYSITALAAAITSFTTNLSGTPTIGQTLWISITDNGTARAITWGASFESSGNVTLPTTTVISTRLDVAFIWNEATSKWRCVGVA